MHIINFRYWRQEAASFGSNIQILFRVSKFFFCLVIITQLDVVKVSFLLQSFHFGAMILNILETRRPQMICLHCRIVM